MNLLNLFFVQKEPEMALFDGTVLMRTQLRQAARKATNKAEADAINKAVADNGFIADVTASTMEAASTSIGMSGTEVVAAGILAAFLQVLIANLPAIIELILTIFGVKPTPVPVPPIQ